MLMFLCMIPIPPSLDIAIARRASVTVSMAALTMGMFISRPFVSLVLVLVSLGNTSEYLGKTSTSSKVNPRCDILDSLNGDICK